MKRTLVIGDIHGGLKALIQVFDRASVASADRLIFLGDYVDGWSDSAQVTDYVMSLGERFIYTQGLPLCMVRSKNFIPPISAGIERCGKWH